jgi:hypothetical protein
MPPEKEKPMSLSGDNVKTSIAVSDIVRAAEFYEGKLGLAAAEIQPDESRIYRVAWFRDPDGNRFAIEEGTTP